MIQGATSGHLKRTFGGPRLRLSWRDKNVSRSVVLSPTEAMQLARGERAMCSTLDPKPDEGWPTRYERVVHAEETGEFALAHAGHVLIVAWPAAGSSCEPREANDRLDCSP